ncbi:MAG: helix-turn-helix transcriptional regulator [Bacillota bacterium]
MKFTFDDLPDDMKETLEAIYEKAKKINGSLTEREFFKRMVFDWLEPYRREVGSIPPRKNVVLKNKLRETMKYYKKTQAEVAKYVGVSRNYIGQIISGDSVPTITIALLICNSLDLPPEKVGELFFLESID